LRPSKRADVALRIIPRLDIKAPNLVKGVRLEGFRVMGQPSAFARRYFEEGADELLYQDIVASLYERNSILDLVRETAEQVFIPLTVGGGLRTIEDITAALRAGADKVCMNTAAVRRPALISESVRVFGRQCVTVAIETIRQKSGRWEVFVDCGREHTGLDAYDWALKAVELGAGELLITSVDRDGTLGGYDLDLLARIVPKVDVPVLAHGGAGTLEHFTTAARLGVSGLVIATVLHKNILDIAAIKAHLLAAAIDVRPCPQVPSI
jgi:imidazole glycerol-phosphate synthase subunit HisF